MKFKYILFFLFISASAFCQGEASNWYFGQHAGISFSSGAPVPLTDMPMTSENLRTHEGCTSISGNNGNLLFYTDGTKVWDRNHEVMFNGTDLHGNSSSSQSAIVVPKPDSQTNYYIFTVDRLGSSLYGLQYSEVDMTLNDGLGDVTIKNIPLLDQCSEKITAVKSSDCSEIWVIAYSSAGGFEDGNYNTFFSYKITPAGVQTVPVVSPTALAGTDDGRGYLKVSADGTKIAIAHQGEPGNNLFLYNFDKQTGAVTNQQKLIMSDPTHPNNKPNTQPYGIEFSLSTNKLYVTSSTPEFQTYLWQFNLLAANAVKLISYHGNNSYRGALQMAPDGKIYRALAIEYEIGSRYLGVIHNPEAAGIACNYQHDAIDLDPNNEGRRSMQGLPPFIQSLFLTKIDIIAPGTAGLDTDLDLCFGDTYRLNGPIVAGATYNWYVNGTLKTPYNVNYLDVDINIPSLVVYKLMIDKNDGSCPIEGQASVTYYPLPTINSPVTLKQCDTDTDGISNFNLTEKNNYISANSANETFTYYTTSGAANTEDATFLIANPNVHSSGNSTVWVRVENANGCFRTAQLDLVVSTTQVPATFRPMLYKCDDFLDIDGNNTANNDDRDGIATFDLSNVSTSITNMLPPPASAFTIKYYKNEADFAAEINEITNINNYRNIGYPNMQLIWVRVDSTVDNGCYGYANVTLTVEALPTAYPVTIGRECDDDQDGKFPFNTSSILPTLLNGQTNVTVTYFNENNTIIPTGGSNQLPNPFNTSSQTITIRVSNNNTSVPSGPCYDETTLEFIVDVLPKANTVVIPAECEDDPDPATADGLYPFNTSTIESNILGSLTGMNVSYFDQNGFELPSPLPNPFLTATQDVTVTVENPLNANCTLPPTVLRFVVNPLPNIALVHRELVCSHQSTFTTVLDAGILDNTPPSAYTYQWYYEGTILPSETNPTLTVTAEGIYTVEVTTNLGCSRSRVITVVHSSDANFTIESVDLSDDNSITINLSTDSFGDYVFSLDHENAYQTSNIFTNVAPGIYTVYVKDLNGCDSESQTAYILGVPPYFTPNGDNINDTWNIKGVRSENYNSIIYIFDRYGKLIKQLGTTGEGWNGTFNGQLMPSTDYWYAVYLKDGRIINGHFALKR